MFFSIIWYFLLVPICQSATVENTEPRKDTSWTLRFTLENDLFANTDENYTNGIKLSWISPDLSPEYRNNALPAWSTAIINTMPYRDKLDIQRNIGFSIGQKIFTPQDIESTELIPNDRPYAGWLYVSASYYNKTQTTLDTFALQLGIVGPAALGEEAQNSVHRFRGLKEANGWDNQLQNEPGFLLLAERKWRVYRIADPKTHLGMDIISHLGTSLGNVMTYINTGAEFRFGWNIPTDFGTSLIRPGGDANSPSNNKDTRFSKTDHLGFYVFAAYSGRIVLHDIFLDGNTFASSHSVNKEYFVGDLIIGASILLYDFKMSYAQVFRSKEFEGQGGGSSFGSISISYSF